MEGCNYKLPECKVLDAVDKLVGKNLDIKKEIYLTATDGVNFTEEFKEWYKDKHKTDTIPSFNTTNTSEAKKLASDVMAYYREKKPSVDNTVRKDLAIIDEAKQFGYTSVFEREEGIKHVGNIILKAFMEAESLGTTLPNNKLDYYKKEARKVWLTKLFNVASALQGKTIQELRAEYNALEDQADKTKYINKILGGNNKSITETNYYAVYQELFGTDEISSAYISQVISNPNLIDVYQQTKKDINEEAAKLAEESIKAEDKNSTEEIVASDDIAEFDTSITSYNNHIGVYTNFMAHIGTKIRNYFNTLEKLQSKNIGDVDTNNTYGIPDTMDANACASMLYNQGSFRNITDFINQIRNIGNTVPGYEAFLQLAEDLTKDKDFATEMFTVFAKTKIGKTQVRVIDGKPTTVISNEVADKRTMFVFNLRNDSKKAIANGNSDIVTKLGNDLKTDIEAAKRIAYNSKNAKSETDREKNKLNAEKQLIALKERVVRYIKGWYPSIQEGAIVAYIDFNNNNGDIYTKFQNAEDLVSDIQSAAKDSEQSVKAYNEIQRQLKEIYDHNRQVREHAQKGNWVDANEYRSTSEINTDDYLSFQESSVQNITEKLLNYSDVPVNLNSPNVYGNNNSSIINNSMITAYHKMLDGFYYDTITVNGVERKQLRNKELEEWGIKKIKNKPQYKYNPLFVEQYDEQGNILNEGKALFRYVNGNLCLTDNAQYALQIHLFDGSSEMDEGNNSSYADMTSGSYGPTSFIQFFTASDRLYKGKLADYFLRTPSDAPKNFTVRSIPYDTTDLFVLADPEKVESEVNQLVGEKVAAISKNNWKESYKNPQANEEQAYIEIENVDDINQYLFPKKDIYVKNYLALNETDVKFGDNNVGYLTVKVGDSFIVLQGEVIKVGKGKALSNATAISTIDLTTSDNSARMSELVYNNLHHYYFQKLLKEDVEIGIENEVVIFPKAEYKLDTNHPVFKLIKNQFKQEMLDAAKAVEHYFDLIPVKNGSKEYVVKTFKDENGDGKLHFSFRKDRRNDKGYAAYHLDKNGKVFTETETGYTLGGRVFNTEKFTLYTRNDEGEYEARNYLQDLISTEIEDDPGKINLLYGGAMKFIVGENGVEDVKFSKEQEAAINERISEFLKDYIAQANIEIYNYAQFIPASLYTSDNVTTYAINQLLMHYNYDALFEGNIKFYKSTQDILKRAKETQGSGVPFGIVDYADMSEPSTDTIEDAFLTSGELVEIEYEIVEDKGKKIRRPAKDENGKIKTKTTKIQDIFHNATDKILDGVVQRKGFTAVTVKNSVKTNNTTLRELADILIKKGLDKEYVETMLWGSVVVKDGVIQLDKNTGLPKRKGGFTDTKVNDAQSYITFQEWVRRISARGQLKKYLPLIKKIINSPDSLTAEDIKEFIQVQKNFYYDLHYDPEYNIEVPRQIKNAEFVLVPALIKGTQLAKVYEKMVEAGIDQLNTVETSKASNEELITLWDNNGDITDERLNGFVEKAKTNQQVYSYNNLYTQQETPQHMNSENKAGIQIVKKIIDNLPNTGELGKLKKQFFDNFSANIEESYLNVIREFDIPVDEKGNIKRDKNGNIEGINMAAFLDKLKQEFIRTGMDSNLADYVTIPKNSSLPIMPSSMNNILTRFESVVQSLFNNAITRQRLPGFHAAQVTNVGWKAMGDEVPNVSYCQELKYHPDGEPYIEVMLPYSFLGIDKNSAHYKDMSDEDIIKELEKEHLDKVIGYRIPTEGKQSVCVMKIKGFVSSDLGSTIVVPDDWVAQTGSDFDIDSVYGIQAETYITAIGQVKRINYKEKLSTLDWFNYVHKHVKELDSVNAKAEKIKIKNKISEDDTKTYQELNAKKQEFFNNMPKVLQNIVKSYDSVITKYVRKHNLSPYDANVYRCKTLVNDLSYILPKFASNEKAYKFISDYIDINNKIYQHENNKFEYLAEESQKELEEYYEKHRSEYEEAAKKFNLLSEEEFKDPNNIIKANGTAARNTQIFDTMVSILSDSDCLEENLSRSNFDDLVAERNSNMSEEVANERAARSPYNVFDQIKYQEEAMSGAKLKAFSVTLDTFCSICNTVKPTLNEEVYIVYDVDNYNVDNVKQSFKNTSYHKGSKTFSIRHNTYGWSANNRNVAGRLLTVYSSQTTAFILDAIKEGSIPNLNDYTFSVFKTLANIGTDYKVATAFIMQPGVKMIVDAYNAKNSVFSDSTGNPIDEAIRIIAEELQIPFNSNDRVDSILAKINKQYKKEFNDIFKQKEDDKDITLSLNPEYLVNLPIIASKLTSRLKSNRSFSSPVERSLFDLGVILSFYKLNRTANAVGDIARCCNPDKFGAKQTIFATREVFKKIQECMFKQEERPVEFTDDDGNIIEDSIVLQDRKKPVLSVNDKHILASIYPGCEIEADTVDEVIDNICKNESISSYPSLRMFLKRASATSVILSKQIFETQSNEFLSIIDGLTSVFSGHNPTMTEEINKDFQRYTLTSIYNKIPAIKYPLHVSKGKGKVNITPAVTQKIFDGKQSDENVAHDETFRVFGYERTANLEVIKKEEITNKDGKKINKRVFVEFNVEDVNNPTKDEIELFEQLSPAQKVSFIQSRFSNPGIFGLFQVSLNNAQNRGKWAGMQTISFIEQNISSNVIYGEFRKAFYNMNPLLVSAAIDIVKYSVMVEGLKMSATAVNKVIDNDVLSNEFGSNGLGFVDALRAEMRGIGTLQSSYTLNSNREVLYENYLRSHPDCKGIRKLYISNKTIKENAMYKQAYGVYFMKVDNREKTPEANKDNFDKRMTKLGIKSVLPLSKNYKTNKYIRIVENDISTLYKIHDGGNYIILYPLSDLLENENRDWSVNEDLNTRISILPQNSYRKLIGIYDAIEDKVDFKSKYILDTIKDLKSKGETKDFYYSSREVYERKLYADPNFDINKLAEEGTPMYFLKEAIINYFQDPNHHRFFAYNRDIRDHIYTPGIKYGSMQKINIGPNNTRHFYFAIPTDVKAYEAYFLKPLADGTYRNPADPNLAGNLLGNKSLLTIVQQAQDRKATNLRDLVEITPVEEANASQIDDINLDLADFAEIQNSAEQNNMSLALRQRLATKQIQFNSESFENNKVTVVRELAKYANSQYSAIRKLFDQFVEDPEEANSFISITDDRILAMIKTDANLADRYMKAFNIANGFAERLKPYTEVNIEAEDSEVQHFINELKEIAKKALSLPVNDVLRRGIDSMVTAKTTNPLIRERLLDIFSGFWKTYGYAWQYNDIMENGNPILQVMLKEVLGDLDAKHKQAQRVRVEFKKHIKRIYDEASSKGEVIDMSKIIDEFDRFVQRYTHEYEDTLEELRTKANDEAKLHGLGSIQHLRAKNAYDIFKAQHCNQEASQEYYLQKAAIEQNMIINHPVIYEAYMKLFYERRAIFDNATSQALSEEEKEKLAKINDEMYNLSNNDFYVENGNSYRRPDEDPDPNSPMDERARFLLLRGVNHAYALADALTKLKKLNEEYFEYDADYGFEDQVEKNLAIVRKYEGQFKNVNIPQDELEKIPQYVEARNWLNKNAKFVFNEVYDAENQPLSLGAKLKDAFFRLGMVHRGRNKSVQSYLKRQKPDGIRDKDNIPNGNLLTDEERKEVKERQQSDWGVLGIPSNSDLHLISNARPIDDVYSFDFYRRMSRNGSVNAKYINLITELNTILEKYYSPVDQIVHLERIEDTPEGIEELKKIAEYYQELRKIDKYDDSEESSSTREFIEENVEFAINEPIWNSQNITALSKSSEYVEAWNLVAYERKRDGSFVFENNNFKPNRYLYTYAKPKGNPGEESYDKWVDNQRKEDLELVKNAYKKVPTKYYYQAMAEAMARAEKERNDPDGFKYEDWYDANHIYNPYTRKVEPIEVWLNFEPNYEFFKDDEYGAGWVPRSGQKVRKVKDGVDVHVVNGQTIRIEHPEKDKRNKNYNPNVSLKDNYIQGSGFDNPIQLNDSEKALSEYLQTVLKTASFIPSAKRYFAKGYLPIRMKAEEPSFKSVAKEVGKIVGIGVSSETGVKAFNKDIGYIYDETPNMPMTGILNNKHTVDLQKQLKTIKDTVITREQFNSDIEYEDRIKEQQEAIKKLETQIEEERKAIRDRDWVNVIDNFLEESSVYNAIQENKQKLYFLHSALKQLKMYSREKGSYGDLSIDRRRSSEDNIVYEQSTDEKLIAQYENFLRRILFDQWKEKEGGWTNFANILQGFTSANYMMLNIRGGVANVTLGETGILAEAVAKEYFGGKNWAFGTNEWFAGCISFARSGYHMLVDGSNASYSKQDAIAKFFNVIDYDEKLGVVRGLSLEKYAEKFRDLMFSPQFIGEHFMQNSVLFAMLHSHKLFTTEDGKVVYMNKQQYINHKQNLLLKELLTEEEAVKYEEFKESLKKDANVLKDYAWFRKDALTNYIYLHCSKEQRDAFKERRDKVIKEAEEEFNAKENMYEQIILSDDGHMAFKEGSELAALDSIPANTVSYKQTEQNKEGIPEFNNINDLSEAYALLGNFAEKVRKVNNKIHGVYNKQGAAYIERTWFGSLITQYHKHLPIGILKRYRARGYWNETRGTVEKGMVQSIHDLLSLNLEKIKIDNNLNDHEMGALEGFIFMVTHMHNYLMQIGETWDIIPSYEKANILRNLGDLVGVVGSLATIAALWYIADDDPEMQDSLTFNFLLYEMDRLNSEAFLYNPWGLFNEGKKLMSTPVAAQSVISDAASSLKAISDFLLDDEYDPYYHSGRFAGEAKLSVYIQRRIPIWNGIRSFLDTPSNNHYYKLGRTPMSMFDFSDKAKE